MTYLDEDSHLWRTFYIEANSLAAIRVILGKKPFGPLVDDEDDSDAAYEDEAAFGSLISGVLNDAVEDLADCPERVTLMFERERTHHKLAEMVASDLGLNRRGSDVARTKIRDRLRLLKAEWAENEKNGWPNGEDPTLLSNLLRVDDTITKELSKLGAKVRRPKR